MDRYAGVKAAFLLFGIGVITAGTACVGGRLVSVSARTPGADGTAETVAPEWRVVDGELRIRSGNRWGFGAVTLGYTTLNVRAVQNPDTRTAQRIIDTHAGPRVYLWVPNRVGLVEECHGYVYKTCRDVRARIPRGTFGLAAEGILGLNTRPEGVEYMSGEPALRAGGVVYSFGTYHLSKWVMLEARGGVGSVPDGGFEPFATLGVAIGGFTASTKTAGLLPELGR